MEQCRLLGVKKMGVWSVSWCLSGFNKLRNSRNNRRNSHWLRLDFGRDFCSSFSLEKRSHIVVSKMIMCPCILQYCTATSNSSICFGDAYWMQCNMLKRGLILIIKSCFESFRSDSSSTGLHCYVLHYGAKKDYVENPTPKLPFLVRAFLYWSRLKLHRWLI
jgi:hypothetical protein